MFSVKSKGKKLLNTVRYYWIDKHCNFFSAKDLSITKYICPRISCFYYLNKTIVRVFFQHMYFVCNVLFKLVVWSTVINDFDINGPYRTWLISWPMICTLSPKNIHNIISISTFWTVTNNILPDGKHLGRQRPLNAVI